LAAFLVSNRIGGRVAASLQAPAEAKDFLMNVFLVYMRDENFCRLLPQELDGSASGNGRIKVMGLPPLGIQTLAPVLRRHGHRVRLFDTCHPQMQGEHIAQAAAEERPDVRRRG
jgi:hypothetical protein